MNRKGQTFDTADPWTKPIDALDGDCHLMVQLMEAWFLADVAALNAYYGSGFNDNALPGRTDIEKISKDTVLSSLHESTRHTTKGSYSKGNHAFGILAIIDPYKVMNKSPWAKRFVTLLTEKMHSVR